jgi:hypothetical protein
VVHITGLTRGNPVQCWSRWLLCGKAKGQNSEDYVIGYTSRKGRGMGHTSPWALLKDTGGRGSQGKEGVKTIEATKFVFFSSPQCAIGELKSDARVTIAPMCMGWKGRDQLRHDRTIGSQRGVTYQYSTLSLGYNGSL